MIKIGFKEGVDPKEIEMLTPLAWALLQIFILEATIQGQEVVITSIKDIAKGRESDSHAESRAVDIRTENLWTIDPKEFCEKFNAHYSRLGAISAKTGLPTPCVYHKVEGGAYHIHLQARK